MKTTLNKRKSEHKVQINYNSYNEIIERKLSESERILKNVDISILFSDNYNQKK